MLNKIIEMSINFVFPRSHLEKYLMKASQIQFEQKLTTRMQHQPRQFSPYYYKDKLVKDCVIELKERNNKDVARLFSSILGLYIKREVELIMKKNITSQFYLVPIPQHHSKTKSKGFSHTNTLTKEVYKRIYSSSSRYNIEINPCISKIKHSKNLHSLFGKHIRFASIKNTMQAFLDINKVKTSYYFIIDDVFTTGATFKEARRSLVDSGALSENLYFISIAH